MVVDVILGLVAVTVNSCKGLISEKWQSIKLCSTHSELMHKSKIMSKY